MEALTSWLNEWGYGLGRLLEAQLQSRSPVSILIVFAAGIVTSFTPCVYPMIPVTVSYMGGAAGGNRRRAVTLSVVYVAGLALVYTALGVAAALLGKVFGQFTRSPWVYGGVGLLVLFFGLGMLDIYTIRVPTVFTGVQTKGARTGGLLGALLMGMAAGFVAAPCTAPVLGVLLTYVATTRDVAWGGALLLVFSLGLGLLLMVLGIFSGTLAGLPRAGSWMDRIKKGFGVAMILVGLFFLWQAVRMVMS